MSAPYKTVEEALAALGPLPDGYESSHGPLWSLLDWSLWGAGMGDQFREALADRMVAAIPADGVVHAEALMAEFIRRRQIEKTGVTIYQEQRDELERLRQQITEVVAERDTQFVAWLLKKAREYPTDPARQEKAADAIARLADKVARGALRPNNLHTDFFQPGRTYTHIDDKTDWKFRVDMVTTHPEDGERTALGWRHFRGVWEAIAYDEDDYEIHLCVGLVDVTEGGESR
ncbi:hypothetical protein [Streptomyces sp. NPDC029554]|uniref:hypothetical protein n=1 Tax=Streptomyces sp. NPDC029554 TaxID=3155126 RepID=UPI0033D82EAB